MVNDDIDHIDRIDSESDEGVYDDFMFPIGFPV